MTGETVITVIGNLTNEPELRFTPSGAAVANFTIASTPRQFDRQANEWKDGETLFLRASVWREQAENIAETLTKGTRVIAQGRLRSRSYETKEGEKRTSMELDIEEIGPSLKYATAQVRRRQRADEAARQNASSAWNNPPAGYGSSPVQQQGGWGAPNTPPADWGAQQPPMSEPPF